MQWHRPMPAGSASQDWATPQRLTFPVVLPPPPKDPLPAQRFNYGHYGALRKTREQANTFSKDWQQQRLNQNEFPT